MFVVTAAILFLMWGLYYHLKNIRLYKYSWNVPGPLNLPFIGAGYRLTGTPAEIGAKFNDMFGEYSGFSKMWLLDELYYLTTKPEYLQVILSSSKALEKTPIYQYSKLVLGQGLLTSKANLWKKHRRIITPSFNPKLLVQYPVIISQQSGILLDKFETMAGQEIDQCKYITNCTLDIIGATFFGQDLKTQYSKTMYNEVIDDAMEAVFVRCFKKIYALDFVYKTTKYYKDYIEYAKVLRDLGKRIIQQKLDENGDSLKEESEKIKPFLDIVVDAYLKKEWTMEELEDEVVTFFLAGSDTVGSSVSFVLIMLAMHPEIQEKVYKEVMEVLGPSRLVENEDLQNFSYTERVVKETLRLFPGAPFTGRVLQDDIKLGDYIIPKNATVGIGYLSLHRNEKYWPNPLIFDPDRFLPENSVNRHPFSYIPFSAGPRNCIGFKFGMMSAKILVALMIRKFRVSTTLQKVEDVEITTHIVIKPKPGLKLHFDLR